MTLVIKQNSSAIEKAVSVLNSQGLIIYPTETCYGIGADATDENAIAKVLQIKKRPPEKKVSVAVSSLEMAKKYFSLNHKAEKLAGAFMPGPLTLIVNGNSFRIPSNKFVLKLIEKFGKPITATSANISGQDSIYDIDKIIQIFGGEIDLIIDAGNLPVRKVSTVFDLDMNKILREGAITEQEIMKVLGN